MDVIVRSADFDGMALKVLQFGRPFRAISLCVSFPGLKPWAEHNPALNGAKLRAVQDDFLPRRGDRIQPNATEKELGIS